MNLNIEISISYYYKCGGKKIRKYPGHEFFDGIKSRAEKIYKIRDT